MAPSDATAAVRPLEHDDLETLIRLRRASFGRPRTDDDDEVRTALARRLPYVRGLDADGTLVAAASWYPFPAWIGGTRVPTGALAAVVSAPEGRRRGHVRALIAAGLAELRAAGVGWSGEHPFDPRFYDAFGYRAVPSSCWLDVPFARLPGRASDVAFAEVDRTSPEVRAIRRAFASRRSFTLDRDEPAGFEANDDGLPGRWSGVFEAPEPEATAGSAYLCEGGYAIVATEGFGHAGVLHVADVAWRDAAGRGRVLAMLGAWDGQLGRVRLELPTDDPLARRDGPLFARHRTPLQMRIVDLAAALAPLRVSASRAASVVLALSDAMAPWNDGRWRITTGTDGCSVERCDDAPDAATDAGGLVALLSGTPPAALLAAGEATGSVEALAALQATTADHPPFFGLADYY